MWRQEFRRRNRPIIEKFPVLDLTVDAPADDDDEDDLPTSPLPTVRSGELLDFSTAQRDPLPEEDPSPRSASRPLLDFEPAFVSAGSINDTDGGPARAVVTSYSAAQSRDGFAPFDARNDGVRAESALLNSGNAVEDTFIPASG